MNMIFGSKSLIYRICDTHSSISSTPVKLETIIIHKKRLTKLNKTIVKVISVGHFLNQDLTQRENK